MSLKCWLKFHDIIFYNNNQVILVHGIANQSHYGGRGGECHISQEEDKVSSSPVKVSPITMQTFCRNKNGVNLFYVWFLCKPSVYFQIIHAMCTSKCSKSEYDSEKVWVIIRSTKRKQSLISWPYSLAEKGWLHFALHQSQDMKRFKEILSLDCSTKW